jgi:hypothetical protein
MESRFSSAREASSYKQWPLIPAEDKQAWPGGHVPQLPRLAPHPLFHGPQAPAGHDAVAAQQLPMKQVATSPGGGKSRVQSEPHELQFFGSVCVFTQEPLQQDKPDGQALPTPHETT